jgi:hypothetical protein
VGTPGILSLLIEQPSNYKIAFIGSRCMSRSR